MISAKPKYYKIKTSNHIPNSNVKALKEKIEQINNLDKDELKELYREALSKRFL